MQPVTSGVTVGVTLLILVGLLLFFFCHAHFLLPNPSPRRTRAKKKKELGWLISRTSICPEKEKKREVTADVCLRGANFMGGGGA